MNQSKRVPSIFCWIFSLTFSILLSGSDTEKLDADGFIRVERLGEKALLLCMGYDVVFAIETLQGVVAIDAGISNSLTALYRKRIEQEFGRTGFAYLINTHSHPDHVGGNQVFEDAVIVGHENCLAEISDFSGNLESVRSGLGKTANRYRERLETLTPGIKEWNEIACQVIRYESAFSDVSGSRIVTVPTVTFKDSMDLSLGDCTIQMIHFGKAHSASDILIHVPEFKLLMTGDLFTRGGRLSFRNVNKGDAEKWIRANQWIRKRLDAIETVIEGHGERMGREDLESFIRNVQELIGENR